MSTLMKLFEECWDTATDEGLCKPIGSKQYNEVVYCFLYWVVQRKRKGLSEPTADEIGHWLINQLERNGSGS